MNKLTARQSAFVLEYAVDSNGAQAAIRAGYSPRTAKVQASRLLTNVNVAAAIEKAFEARSERTEIDADRVLEELARLGFSDLSRVVTWSGGDVRLNPSEELPEDVRASIREITITGTGAERKVTVKLHDKKGPLELLMRHLRMFEPDITFNDNRVQVIGITELARRMNGYLDGGSPGSQPGDEGEPGSVPSGDPRS